MAHFQNRGMLPCARKSYVPPVPVRWAHVRVAPFRSTVRVKCSR
jgi:hypothetical protein